eukprot:3797032-Rhodomonas_salina.1
MNIKSSSRDHRTIRPSRVLLEGPGTADRGSSSASTVGWTPSPVLPVTVCLIGEPRAPSPSLRGRNGKRGKGARG